LILADLRKSGILLHPTSLPGPGGIGALGESAYRFADFLHQAGQSLWQVLPLGPTGYGNSPYSSYSAFAGNPLLISLEAIAEEGDLDPAELDVSLPDDRIDYQRVVPFKIGLLGRAAANFFASDDLPRKREFWHFCDNTFWLHDYALFMALKGHYKSKNWRFWPERIARRLPEAVEEFSSLLGPAIGEQKYMQWQFARQWRRLKAYANARNIEVMGDIPIFVAYDSADVWANPHLFHLDENGRPTVVAGVPPDYFSKTGQLWGNPLYDWERMAADGFGWWIARIRNDLLLYDLLRIDHFRGFAACWEVSATARNAVHGRWTPGPGEALFNAMICALGPLPIIAEDLGVITLDVEALRDRFGFPGMKILQFAFGSGPDNPYLPHNHVQNCVVYTGTHDNNTTAGWFASLGDKERRHLCRYLKIAEDEMPWALVRTALASVAHTAVIPLQDILALGSEARMNVPGVAAGNWSWRYQDGALDDRLAGTLRELTDMYGRVGREDVI
jgi:4-alpha-glucanotransferase